MKISTLAAGSLFVAVAMPAAAVETIYTAVLNGASEAPPNDSPAYGTATVTIDLDNGTMRVQESFSDLVAGVSASHIHCCTEIPRMGVAGVATPIPTFTGFPSGVMSGVYDHTFDMTLASSYNPAFVDDNGGTVDGAFGTLVAGLNSGTAYANIHTSEYPGGEIRGFLAPIPEPETYAMLLAGLGIISMVARRRRA
ncbi:MAG: CHRD domain-containing protein [Nitrosospira sp.]|nr:CHRD domain-containing protein [Nitrosospira sp.]